MKCIPTKNCIKRAKLEEREKITGQVIPAQFEVNYETEELQGILSNIFAGWNVLKFTVKEQRYDIPRGNMISELSTNVVTLVVRKCKEAI